MLSTRFFSLLCLTSPVAILVLAGGSNALLGQLHDDDILFSYQNNRIEISSGDVSFLDANRYFEGTFGTTGILNRFTDDPGFESFPNIGGNDQVSFTLLPSRFGTYLTAWDPVSNSILTGHSYSLSIGGDVFIDVTANSGGSLVIGEAASNGYFHEHAPFQLSNNAPSGAYGLLMTLQTNAVGIESSEPFWIIFNYNLDESVFDQGVVAMIGVPEPGAGLIFLALFTAVGLRRDRR